jgi:hypothetical protein
MQRPKFLTRLVAMMSAEVDASTLEAYRRAGSIAYEILQQSENRRLECKIRGVHPWQLDEATRAYLLCSWNAFALQTLGDQFLDADYKANPATVGFVPTVTAEQIAAFYGPVSQWLGRAKQAEDNPGFRLDVPVPAELPPWSEADPCPRPHLDAMIAALHSLQVHAEAAMATFNDQTVPEGRDKDLRKLNELLKKASCEADYARGLCSPKVSQELHEQIEKRAQDAIKDFFRFGQFLAMPELMAVPVQPARVSPPTNAVGIKCDLPLPNQPNFDPWCLTSPDAAKLLQSEPEAQETILELWQHDPQPERTLALQAEIARAMVRGDIAYATHQDGQLLGYYHRTPWAPIYVTKRAVVLDGTVMRQFQQFTLDISADGVLAGGSFTRCIMPGVFSKAKKIEYCDPHEEDHH